MFGVTLFLNKPFSVVIIRTSTQGLNKALSKTLAIHSVCHPSPLGAYNCMTRLSGILAVWSRMTLKKVWQKRAWPIMP